MPAAAQEVEMPWWGYGPQGMQLWFPSSLTPAHSPAAVNAAWRSPPGVGQGAQGSQLTRGGGTPISPPVMAAAQQPAQQDMELEFDHEVRVRCVGVRPEV